MENKPILNPRKALFLILIYSIAAPVIGIFLSLLKADIYIYIPRMFYTFSILPLVPLSFEAVSIWLLVLFSAIPVISYSLCAINSFLTFKKQKTFLIIPTMAFISIDLVFTALIMISGQSFGFGPVLSFVMDTIYLVLLFYIRQDIKQSKKED